MDFKDQLAQISKRISDLKDKVTTEESTKNAFIMPFIQALGYDVFNPLEVVPEFTADVGVKKGEKVDYCILRDGQPTILIECKHWDSILSRQYDSQLYRYFSVTKARFAILTNGIKYRFYSDLEESNKMDEKPFFEVNMLKINDGIVAELKKFRKEQFDLDNILTTANELKYSKLFKEQVINELNEPSDDFARLFISRVYDGRATQRIVDELKPLLLRSIRQYLNERINERLQTALETEKEQQQEDIVIEVAPPEPEIITTEDELRGFRIIQAICTKYADADKIVYRDQKTYFNILYENNNRKPICRLWLNSANWYLGLIDSEKNETKIPIERVEDIYKYEREIIESVTQYVPRAAE